MHRNLHRKMFVFMTIGLAAMGAVYWGLELGSRKLMAREIREIAWLASAQEEVRLQHDQPGYLPGRANTHARACQFALLMEGEFRKEPLLTRVFVSIVGAPRYKGELRKEVGGYPDYLISILGIPEDIRPRK